MFLAAFLPWAHSPASVILLLTTLVIFLSHKPIRICLAAGSPPRSHARARLAGRGARSRVSGCYHAQGGWTCLLIRATQLTLFRFPKLFRVSVFSFIRSHSNKTTNTGAADSGNTWRLCSAAGAGDHKLLWREYLNSVLRDVHLFGLGNPTLSTLGYLLPL